MNRDVLVSFVRTELELQGNELDNGLGEVRAGGRRGQPHARPRAEGQWCRTGVLDLREDSAASALTTVHLTEPLTSRLSFQQEMPVRRAAECLKLARDTEVRVSKVRRMEGAEARPALWTPQTASASFHEPSASLPVQSGHLERGLSALRTPCTPIRTRVPASPEPEGLSWLICLPNHHRMPPMGQVFSSCLVKK